MLFSLKILNSQKLFAYIKIFHKISSNIVPTTKVTNSIINFYIIEKKLGKKVEAISLNLTLGRFTKLISTCSTTTFFVENE